jgi:hypothetical protein
MVSDKIYLDTAARAEKDEKSGAAERENPGEYVKVLKQYIVQGLLCHGFVCPGFVCVPIH